MLRISHNVSTNERKYNEKTTTSHLVVECYLYALSLSFASGLISYICNSFFCIYFQFVVFLFVCLFHFFVLFCFVARSLQNLFHILACTFSFYFMLFFLCSFPPPFPYFFIVSSFLSRSLTFHFTLVKRNHGARKRKVDFYIGGGRTSFLRNIMVSVFCFQFPLPFT